MKDILSALKKNCEILSTRNKVISAYVDLPKVENGRSAYANAFEFGPRDFNAKKILPPPLITSPVGLRAPGGLKLGPKFLVFFYFQREISRMHRPTGVKFCTLVSTRPSFIMPVQNFGGGGTPQKILEVKNMQNLARFRTTLKFGGEYLRNRWRYSKSNKSVFDSDSSQKQSSVKFGLLTLEI